MANLANARQAAVLLHRWAGLGMAAFLIVCGLTGSLLAWNETLERAFWPVLAPVAAPVAGVRPLGAVELRRRVLATIPGTTAAAPAHGPTNDDADRALPVRFGIAPGGANSGIAPGGANSDGDDEVYVDPYTGRELGRRRWGDLDQGAKNLMPFIHRLHRSLALGSFGSDLLGIVALVWTFDCFVGAALTLPRGRPLLAKWKPAWSVQARRLNLDLHRAGGLWLWLLLLVFAWSSVGFNLPRVHSSVMEMFAASPVTAPPSGASVGDASVSGWLVALHTARIGGPAIQLLVCLLGLAVAGLSATGAVIWGRKRRGRLAARRAAAQRAGRPVARQVSVPRPAVNAASREHRSTEPSYPAAASRKDRNNRARPPPSPDSLLRWPTKTPKTEISPPRSAS